ncbi:unnamed protein product, partial [Gadus morhua 'NCC']
MSGGLKSSTILPSPPPGQSGTLGLQPEVLVASLGSNRGQLQGSPFTWKTNSVHVRGVGWNCEGGQRFSTTTLQETPLAMHVMLRRNPKQKRRNPASPSVSDPGLLAWPDSRHAYLKCGGEPALNVEAELKQQQQSLVV